MSNSNARVKIDARRRPLVVIENKMPRPQTVKVRLTIECEFTRQEVYDAIRSRFDDSAPPTEKQMDAIWERLSENSLGYTDVSDAVFAEDEADLCDKIKDGLADVLNDEGLLEDEDDDEPNCICCPDKPSVGTYGKNNDPLCAPCRDEQQYCSCGVKSVDCEDVCSKLATEDVRYDPDTTVVTGITCKPCGKELPPMTMTEHLNGRGCPCQQEEIDETDGWEEVYNAGHKTAGNPLGGQPRENPRLPGQEGIFYQTYGNGGGAGGWGGYWAMRVSNGQHVGCPYEVAGEEFKLLEGVELEFRPQDSWRGVCAAVRLVPLTQERIAEALRKQALYQQEKQRILKEMADVKERAAVEVEMRQRADRLLRGTAV